MASRSSQQTTRLRPGPVKADRVGQETAGCGGYGASWPGRTNAYAPEHMQIAARDEGRLLARLSETLPASGAPAALDGQQRAEGGLPREPDAQRQRQHLQQAYPGVLGLPGT